MHGWGSLLVVVGGLLIAMAVFAIDTSVPLYSRGGLYGLPDSVQNLGLMQTQMMVFLGGLASALAGVILVAAAAVTDEMRRAREAIDAVEPQAAPPPPPPLPVPPVSPPAPLELREEAFDTGSVERTVGIWSMVALVLTVLFFAYALGYLGGESANTNGSATSNISEVPADTSSAP